MKMYYYALLTSLDTCHTIIECSEERKDINDEHVEIDSYDSSYLNSLWTGSGWVHPPSEGHTWDGKAWRLTRPPIGEDHVHDGTEWVLRSTLE